MQRSLQVVIRQMFVLCSLKIVLHEIKYFFLKLHSDIQILLQI
jgi:hypothetical protein